MYLAQLVELILRFLVPTVETHTEIAALAYLPQETTKRPKSRILWSFGRLPASFPEREIAALPDDLKVQQVDTDQASRRSQPLAQCHIVARRSRIARWMVVRDDHTCRVGQQRRLEHVAWMDRAAVECAPAQLVCADDGMLGRKQNEVAHLDGFVLQRSSSTAASAGLLMCGKGAEAPPPRYTIRSSRAMVTGWLLERLIGNQDLVPQPILRDRIDGWPEPERPALAVDAVRGAPGT